MAKLRTVMDFVCWIGQELKWIMRVIYSSCHRFYWDNGFSKAASLAYTTLFSLVPVTVFGFGILASVVLANETLLEQVRSFIIKQFVPSAAGADIVLEYLKTFGAQVMTLLSFEDSNFSVSLFALIFLVVSCLILINSIEYALNLVWQVFEPRSMAHRLSVFCTLIVVTPVLAVSAFYTSIFIGQQMSNFVMLDQVYGRLVPFLIDCAVFVILYYLVPKAPVRVSSAIFGAFLAALLFDLAKYGFSIYISSYSSYQRIYGPISTIVIFLFWLYLSWTIILLGAEFSYQVQYLPKKGKLLKRNFMSVGDGKLLLAIQALLIIGKAFRKGGRLPNDLEIAENLGCSSLVLRPILSELKHAEIINQRDSREGALALARSPEKISLLELRELLLRGGSPLHYPIQMSAIFTYLASYDGTSGHSLADVLSIEDT